MIFMFAVYTSQFGVSEKLLTTTWNFTYHTLKIVCNNSFKKRVDVSEPLFGTLKATPKSWQFG